MILFKIIKGKRQTILTKKKGKKEGKEMSFGRESSFIEIIFNEQTIKAT